MFALAPPLAITGIGPICPEGCSIAELCADPAPRPAGAGWFQVEHHLGPKGFKYYTSATRLLLAAARRAIENAQVEPGAYPAEKQGVAVGTNFTSYRLAEQFNQCLREDGAEAIQPMEAPNFSINIPASWVSIRHRYQAFNLTFTEPFVAGLHAILLGSQAVSAGRADMVLAAATEDTPPPHAAKCLGLADLQEAACAILLEQHDSAVARGAASYAFLERGFLGNTAGATLWERLRGWLTDAGSEQLRQSEEPIPCCVTSALDGPHRAKLADVLTEVGLPFVPVNRFAPGTRYASVSPVLQFAYLAARYGRGLILVGGPAGHIVGINLLSPSSGRREPAHSQGGVS